MMERIGEPSLNPPEDRDWEMACSIVEDVKDEDLAYELESYGLDSKAKEALKSFWLDEFEKKTGQPLQGRSRKVFSSMVDISPFDELISECCEKDETQLLRKILIDYQYNKLQSEER